MKLSDFHVHTNFSDGKDSPEEVVLSAIEMGMTQIGISDHGYTAFDTSYCIPKERVEQYRKTVLDLKEKYHGRIDIYLGIEQDVFSGVPKEKYDYIIGSAHYVSVGDEYIAADFTPDLLTSAVNRLFDGDFYALTEEYFKIVSETVERTNCDIIGHFDLITKFQERATLFDENHPRYIEQYTRALDRLLRHGKPFEINTGAISRGYRTTPYPSQRIIDYIKSHGGRLLLSSDSHSKDTLCYEFKKWEKIL